MDAASFSKEPAEDRNRKDLNERRRFQSWLFFRLGVMELLFSRNLSFRLEFMVASLLLRMVLLAPWSYLLQSMPTLVAARLNDLKF